MAETVATITPETTEPVAPKTETPREDFNTMPLEDLKKIVEEKLERVPACSKVVCSRRDHKPLGISAHPQTNKL